MAFLLAAGSPPLLSAPRGEHGAGRAASPASGGVLAADKGKFRDIVNSKQVGSEQYDISANGSEWVARGEAEVKSAKGPSTHITSLLRLNADGAPVHYEWATTTGDKKAGATIDFSNGTATIQLVMNGGKPFTQQFFFKTPIVVILDDNMYHQYGILARIYDWSKKGAQTFPVLIPQEMTPGTITVEAEDPENVDGKSMQRLRVHTADLDLTLYLDKDRLYRIAVPSANAEIDRE
ncbi:MAG: hypothetical protein WBE20_16590 [Candidatus Acidiferrales bacterium]